MLCRSFISGKRGEIFYASAEGSCMGVEDNRREISVDFSEGNSATIEVKDSSVNGKIWRLNTPEFNEVEILKNGFILTAPDGSKMKVTAPGEQITGAITVGSGKYGGSTVSNNHGIGFGDKYWLYNKAIDIPCDGNIEVVIKLEKQV